jgi:hypothetical protein
MGLVLHEEHLVYTTQMPNEVEGVISLGKPESELKAGEVPNAGCITRGSQKLRWEPKFDGLGGVGDGGGVDFVKACRGSRHIDPLGGGETLDSLGEKTTLITDGGIVIGVETFRSQPSSKPGMS